MLCLGNELLGDDSFGYLVADELRRFAFPGVEIISTSESGLHLLDHILGAERLIVIDTIQTGDAPPGTVFRFCAGDLSHFPGRSPHAIGLFETLDLGAQLRLPVPREVLVLAVETHDCLTLGAPVSPEVRTAIPVITDMVHDLLAARAQT